ncbi:MAG: CRISPR-associated RAMP protein Csx7 [Desulfurococcaceae archaeon]|jgi:CRISPR-associated RAMP protein (TIGR02581 family)|nr:CRISPR-associated RAMP protein Csx7 [Desulfurococcaceae archaeon]
MAQSFGWIGHHEVKRVIVVEGVIENTEPLRIGVGKGVALESPTDLEVLKVYDVKSDRFVPVVPGSSWKGVFRSSAVAIARSLGLTNVCDGVPGAVHPYPTTREKSRFIDDWKKRSANEKIHKVIEGEVDLCLLCLIFGSPALYSHVIFYDSLPVSEYRLSYRTGIAIDRRTGAARRGALYTVEYVEPGAKFSFKFEATNLPNYAVGLLAQVIMDIATGFVKIGGLKSRGFGAIKFLDLKVKVFDRKVGSFVERGVIEALDSIDKPVEFVGDWRRDLESFRKVFLDVLPVLKKVNDSGWRWGVVFAETK